MATTAQKIEYAEVAAPSTPAAAKVVTYAKSDGLVYSKDDAGVETLMSSGPAAGGGTDLHPGTSFPGSPANNDLCYRTDRDLLYFYDGTRWLTVNEYQIDAAFLGTSGISADNAGAFLFPVLSDGSIYLTKFFANTYVSATAIWLVELYAVASAGNAETLITSLSTSGDSAGAGTRHETDINALVANGTFMLRIGFNETTGSAVFTGAASLRYRRVG